MLAQVPKYVLSALKPSPRESKSPADTVKSAISRPVVRTYVVVADLSFER